MTPREYIGFEAEEKKRLSQLSAEWYVPLNSRKRWTLNKALLTMQDFKISQEDVPLIIKLVENPKYDIGLFSGNVDLHSHDCIHVLLGRGLLVKDEAFVIGFTMGATRKMSRWRRNLFMFISKYLYPEGYKFGEEERYVFNSAVLLGQRCPIDLSKVDFYDNKILTAPLSKLRANLGIDKKEINRYYSLEGSLFDESRRLS
jgi:hypothetical protein